MTKPTIRVLHSVGTFLEISENWIYPQIASVPDTAGFLITGNLKNQGTFPLGQGHLVVCPSPWNWTFRGRRLLERIERRIISKRILKRLKIQTDQAHVLHAHFGTQGWKALLLQQWLAIPLVTSFYGSDAWFLPELGPCWRNRYKELFAAGKLFLVEGPAMRSRLRELGCPEEKIVIQRIGVDIAALQFEKKTFSTGLKIVMLGRFVEKKGLFDGLRACALARAQEVKLEVTIIGDSPANHLAGQRIRAQLQALAGEPLLSGSVHFTGFIPIERARAVISENNVFLCPSKHALNGDAEGGAPVILTEAMAAGLLCVGTWHCDIPEVIHSGVTGLLCSEGDVEGMAKILCDVGERRVNCAQMCEAGRRHVEQNFSLERQMTILRGIYESILKE
jgi:colanic acid/amylovoran biosynthesis glycosyltransferase